MDEGEDVVGVVVGFVVGVVVGVAVTVAADGGLSNPASLILNLGSVVVHTTQEVGLGHLGDQVGGSDHHPGHNEQTKSVGSRLLMLAVLSALNGLT